jgi:acetyl-CoA C-acetyltransferase
MENKMKNEILILGSARTPIGTFGGSLSSVSPISMASHVVKESIKRSKIESTQIGQVIFGHVINTEPKDMYLSRVAAIKAEIPETTPAMNVNRLCGSGAQAIVSVFQSLTMGDCEFGLAGGAENMSRSPHIISSARWGQKMGNSKLEDMMIGALTCPFDSVHMGVTAENVAKQYQVSRLQQDSFAENSQKKAIHSIKVGRFVEQIAPIQIAKKNTTITFDTDEHPKATDLASLSQLKPVFLRDGSVTAGNSSGINDGAASIVMATSLAASKNNLKPEAKLLGYAHSGVKPNIMGIGPITAVRNLCKKLQLKIQDFDVIESNEAFASQACAVNNELEFELEKVNPNGGAIALGHPVGATGVILTIKAIAELKRTNKKLALITMCIGGGQGIAIALENI